MSTENCPCGLSRSLANCCGPLLEGKRLASTSEELMRSRYSAFSMKQIDYIFKTLDPQARSDFDRQTNEQWARESVFYKLEVLNSKDEGNKGTVEFKAYFRSADGKDQVHHEISKFRKQGGIWFFREGRTLGRN